jgi:hypothetical protein
MDLKTLHARATEARDAAHRAYEIALKNRQGPSDTDDAYAALIKSNMVRNDIYAMQLELVIAERKASQAND